MRCAASILVLLVLAAGCAGQPVEQIGPATYRIECSGGYHNWRGCLKTAERVCPRYEVVSRVSDETSSGVGVNDWDNEGTEVTRFMTVRCVPPS